MWRWLRPKVKLPMPPVRLERDDSLAVYCSLKLAVDYDAAVNLGAVRETIVDFVNWSKTRPGTLDLDTLWHHFVLANGGKTAFTTHLLSKSMAWVR